MRHGGFSIIHICKVFNVRRDYPYCIGEVTKRLFKYDNTAGRTGGHARKVAIGQTTELCRVMKSAVGRSGGTTTKFNCTTSVSLN